MLTLELHFIVTEAANLIWKKSRRREILDAERYLEELDRLPEIIVLRQTSCGRGRRWTIHSR